MPPWRYGETASLADNWATEGVVAAKQIATEVGPTTLNGATATAAKTEDPDVAEINYLNQFRLDDSGTTTRTVRLDGELADYALVVIVAGSQERCLAALDPDGSLPGQGVGATTRDRHPGLPDPERQLRRE